jgi:HAD superfamily hydrolase (TIGR01509 family)
MMRLLQGLIFDVDGTLADTEEIHRRAFNLTFRRCGLPWNWTPGLYEQLLVISGGKERITHYAHQVSSALTLSPEFATFVRDLHSAKTACYAELLLSSRVRLRAGVERLLHEARGQGIALGIATSSAWSNLKTLLDNNLPTEWPTWFGAIETCDSIQIKKPSPAVYAAVLRRLGLPPGRCLALEDTENGLAAARAAGISTVITAHDFTRRSRFEGAAAVLDGLGDPGRPTTVMRGPSCGQRFVDLHYLEGLLQEKHPGSTTLWEQNQLTFA